MKTVFLNSQKVSFIMGLLFYAIFNSTTLGAQDVVSRGLDSLETFFHIKYEMPKGFNDLNTAQLWHPAKSILWSSALCWVFESKDKQCRVLYSVFPWYYPGIYTHRDKMRLEFKGILNTNDFVLDDYLRVLSSEEARKRFNADSIFLYDVPTAVPDIGDEKFTHCTRMFIVKQNRAELDLVWYFTEKGKKKEEKYMQKINKHIWYNDGHWNWDLQRVEEWMKTYFKEIMEGKSIYTLYRDP
jgi:hypothetical protein